MTFEAIDFEDFHRSELPARIAAGNGKAAWLGVSDLPALGIRLQETGAAYTYRAASGGVDVAAGDDAAEVVVALRSEDWQGLVHDLESPPSLLYHDSAERVRGDLMHFVRWEAGLRALYTGRPVYDPVALDLRDPSGNPLDATRGFQLDDDPEEMAHFLREVGYLLVKGVFSPEEVASFHRAATALRGVAQKGDQKSWWCKRADGEEVLCRVLEAGRESALQGLPDDPRILGLVALTDEKMVTKRLGEYAGVSVLFKNPGIEEGLSDLPWHRDCGMGGHASMCPTLVGSIFLAANTPENGALRFLPGSWKASYRFEDAADEASHAGVVVPAEPGDLTLHYGDGWHAAPPPTTDDGDFRSCLLVGYAREGAFNHRGERHYNDVLLGDESGQVKNMTTVASKF
jgi:hypothetical protein